MCQIAFSLIAELLFKYYYWQVLFAGKDVMQEMIILLGYEYPSMFRECEGKKYLKEKIMHILLLLLL